MLQLDLNFVNSSSLFKDSCQVQTDTDYPGNDIASDKTNSYQECRALCEVAAGCNAYTYSLGSKACYLKSNISRSSHNSNVASGKPCKKSKNWS